MAEYTQQIDGISAKLDGISAAVAQVDQTIQGLSGDAGLVVDDSTVAGKLDDVVTALGSVGGDAVDYSAQLGQVSKLLVYTDLLLLVLITFLVVGVGVFVGSKVTERMRLRG